MVFDRLLSYYILPAQRSVPKNCPLTIDNTGHSTLSQLLLATSDGAWLDTLVIKPQGLPNDAPHVIYFCGMRGSYTRKIHHYQSRAEKFGHIAVCFDYRNVGNSRGVIYTQTQLINDGKTQVNRLLQAGIKATHITLYGISLGGAVATLVASDFHRNNLRVRLINDRSFSKLSDAIVLPPRYAAVKFFITLMATFFHWELNALAAAKYIHPTDIFIIAAKGDKLISYQQASFYQGLKPELKKMYSLVDFKAKSHAYKVANSEELNKCNDDPADPESKYGVHGALLENLIDKASKPIIDSVFSFVAKRNFGNSEKNTSFCIAKQPSTPLVRRSRL